MKKLFIFIVILIMSFNAYAGRGCCSHHNGVCGCSETGRTICCDGSFSPSCRCGR